MTSKFRDAKAVVKPAERQKIATRISQMFKTATATLNSMSAQYKPKQKAVAPKQNTTAKPAQPKQNLVLLIQMKRMNDMRQRAA